MTLGELNIPDSLAALPRWLLWKMIDGRKVPYQHLGYPARSTDPTHWTTLEHAYAALQRGSYTGLGFVFCEADGLVGIDLDDCFEDNGELKQWAAPLVGALSVTYTEVSPSGTGLKAWCRGTIPKAIKTPITLDGETVGALEVYCRARYFTFTGRRYQDAPLEVADCQDVIDFIAETLAPQRDGPAREYPTKFAHGTQHNNLCRVLGVLRRHGVCDDAIEACLQVVNQQQCEHPGPQENITRMVRSSSEWDGTNG